MWISSTANTTGRTHGFTGMKKEKRKSTFVVGMGKEAKHILLPNYCMAEHGINDDNTFCFYHQPESSKTIRSVRRKEDKNQNYVLFDQIQRSSSRHDNYVFLKLTAGGFQVGRQKAIDNELKTSKQD